MQTSLAKQTSSRELSADSVVKLIFAFGYFFLVHQFCRLYYLWFDLSFKSLLPLRICDRADFQSLRLRLSLTASMEAASSFQPLLDSNQTTFNSNAMGTSMDVDMDIDIDLGPLPEPEPIQLVSNLDSSAHTVYVIRA